MIQRERRRLLKLPFRECVKQTGRLGGRITQRHIDHMSMLCMNENYDKYRELLVPNQALMVIGEVNNDEDKPKLFPQEIMRLEDAPRRYTSQVHFRLNEAQLSGERLEAARQLAEAHRGKIPLFLCVKRTAGELVFIEAHERWNVAPSLPFQQAVDELFGEDTYYAKVDTRLPERVQRKWERKGEQSASE